MSFADLPVEINIDILSLAIVSHPVPSHVLAVNSLFYALAHPLLYTHLYFHSVDQLAQFISCRKIQDLSRPKFTIPLPKTITLDIAAASSRDKIYNLSASSLFCVLVFGYKLPGLRQDNGNIVPTKLDLEVLHLRMNSYSGDPDLQDMENAFSRVDPRIFVWTGGTVLDHHFSIAIVSSAAGRLFRAMQTWTRVQHITLTHVSFPGPAPSSSSLPPSPTLTPTSPSVPRRFLPPLKTLRTLLIDSAILLNPPCVADFVCASSPELQRVSLVDAYCVSIWGQRVRRSDVERAAACLGSHGGSENGNGEADVSVCEDEARIRVLRVRDVVSCEKRTERIMGGDRVEGSSILE